LLDKENAEYCIICETEEEQENIEVLEYSFEEAINMVNNGEDRATLLCTYGKYELRYNNKTRLSEF